MSKDNKQTNNDTYLSDANMMSTIIPNEIFKTSIMNPIEDQSEYLIYSWDNPTHCAIDVYHTGEIVLLVEKDGQQDIIELADKSSYLSHLKKLEDRIKELENKFCIGLYNNF